MITLTRPEPLLVLCEEPVDAPPPVPDDVQVRRSRRFVFLEPPSPEVIDELCRIDLR